MERNKHRTLFTSAALHPSRSLSSALTHTLIGSDWQDAKAHKTPALMTTPIAGGDILCVCSRIEWSSL